MIDKVTSLEHSCVIGTLITCILQLRKLKIREVVWLAWGHTAILRHKGKSSGGNQETGCYPSLGHWLASGKCPEVVQPPGTEASPPNHIGHMDSLCPTYALSLIPVKVMWTFPRSIYHNTLWGKKTPWCIKKFFGLNLKNWSGLLEAGFFFILVNSVIHWNENLLIYSAVPGLTAVHWIFDLHCGLQTL